MLHWNIPTILLRVALTLQRGVRHSAAVGNIQLLHPQVLRRIHDHGVAQEPAEPQSQLLNRLALIDQCLEVYK